MISNFSLHDSGDASLLFESQFWGTATAAQDTPTGPSPGTCCPLPRRQRDRAPNQQPGGDCSPSAAHPGQVPAPSTPVFLRSCLPVWCCGHCLSPTRRRTPWGQGVCQWAGEPQQVVFKETIINVPYLFHNDSDNHRRAADSRSTSPELSPQQAPCVNASRVARLRLGRQRGTGRGPGPRHPLSGGPPLTPRDLRSGLPQASRPPWSLSTPWGLSPADVQAGSSQGLTLLVSRWL